MVFDPQQLAAGVASVINGSPRAGYGLTDAADVVCPADVTKAGNAFQCSLQIAGSGKSVDVMVTGDDETAQAGGPPSGDHRWPTRCESAAAGSGAAAGLIDAHTKGGKTLTLVGRRAPLRCLPAQR